MTKKIIVNGCHEHLDGHIECGDELFCYISDYKNKGVYLLRIQKYIDNKTLPDNCPLDDEQDLRIILMPLVPQQYGEALSIYPWIKCEPHEWDNRTTLENTVWLLGKLKDHSLSDIKELKEYAQALQYAMASEKKINLIRQDAVKHIKAVWEKYKDDISGILAHYPYDSVMHDIWNAAFADLENADADANAGGG